MIEFRVHHQKFVNDFLLTVVKSIFQEMISMDTLIVQIMNQAQKLVNADRASLFLVDSKTNQLYARFDFLDRIVRIILFLEEYLTFLEA